MSQASPRARPRPNQRPSAALSRYRLKPGHAGVVGLQWGDEGKGQIVDMLAGRFHLVVRYNGGANAGHSVHIGDRKFALHLIPSGILYPRAVNVVGNGVVVDPQGMLQEIAGLRARGVKVADNLRVSDRAHVVFPWHKLEDALLEKVLSASRGEGQKIGTTGRGIGPCYADKALRGTAVRMGDLLDAGRLRARLDHIVRLKNVVLGALARDCGEGFEPLDAAAVAREFAGYGAALRPHVCDTAQLLHAAMARGRTLLFEGANAALLDVDHGTYPFVTSSATTSLGIYAGAGVPGGRLGEVLGVVKLYTSRVGGGPMPTELHDEAGARIRQVGHEFGTTTGRPRRCGWLDLAAVRYSAMINGATALACTGLAVLAGIHPLRVCVGYQHRGRKIDGFPADADVLAEVTPIYRELPGFDGAIGDCRAYAELPAAARRYIETVERTVGVPVRMVCVGRRRDQILARTG